MLRIASSSRPFVAYRRAWRVLRASPMALIGTGIVGLFILLTLFGSSLAPYSPFDAIPDMKLQPPSALHPFGTDNLSRDVFSRVLAGGREVIGLAGTSSLLAVVIGAILGLFVGYYGGLLDELLMRLFDSLLALPASLLALLLVGAIGASRAGVFIVVVIVYVPIVARVVRSAVLDTKGKAFIEAARMRRESTTYILLREILPNVMPTLMVEASLRFAYAIFFVASLGFLGIGVQPPSPDWGLQVAQARNYWSTAPWMLFFPSAAIALLVIGVNLMADGLRQVFQAPAQDVEG